MRFLVVAGAAGVGKSTLARALARVLALPVVDLDTLTNPLLDAIAERAFPGAHWNDPALRETVRPARYAAVRAVIAEQADAGVGAVAAAPFTAELTGGPEWELLVQACGQEPVVVWLEADDTVIAARRAQRSAARDAHALPAAGIPPAVPHLRLDASLSPAQQVTRVLRHLGVHRELAADAPLLSRRFAAGLFDLDGTLIDSTPAVLRSWSRLAAEYGVGLDLLASGHGQPASSLINAMFPPERVDEALDRISELEAEDVADVALIPGSRAVFEAIPRRAIVTSGTRLIAGNRIAAAGVARPDVVVTFDDVERGKPDPEPFARAAALLGVAGADCVAFEDAPAGIVAAQGAGCAVVAITGTHDTAELGAADLVVDRLDQLEVVPDGDGFRLAIR
ncbi:MAG: HAD-IA family hydrolase [Microbacterium sp.]|uniref:HAD-IA family hydrolase n=1 Tax=Microbacterium sp. TaxID=51671 RepID=UPI0039E32ACF